MRKTYSILAVAITTSACSGGPLETPTQDSHQQLVDELSRTSLADAIANKAHFMPLCDTNGYPLPGNVNNKSGGTTPTEFCDAVRKPDMTPVTPPAKPECPAQLNEELSYNTLDAALEKYMTFRPICDADGYPLCGNLNGKVITTASEFCQALRDKKLQ